MKMSKVTLIGNYLGKEKIKLANWNYRIVKRKINEEDEYSIREVYYNDDGSIFGLDNNPVIVCCDMLDDLKEITKRLLACIDYPILNEDQVVCIDQEDLHGH